LPLVCSPAQAQNRELHFFLTVRDSHSCHSYDSCLLSQAASGDVSFAFGSFGGVADVGEIAVTGSTFGDKVDLGSTRAGVALASNVTGRVFVMYSVQNVRSRFTADPVPNNAADHLVAVRYNTSASVWQYNIGSGGGAGWRNFTPVEGDRLLGEMNYTTQTATTFRGQSTVIFGVNAGYAIGDLDIEAFRYNGAASTGNLSVSGTYFATRAGTTSYTWDTRGRLTGATTIDTSSRVIAQTVYQYDVQDRRIGRTENSEGVIVDRDRYLYQGEHVAAVASDSDGDGNYRITDRYLHSMATDAVLSMVSSAEASGESLNAPTTASLASADLLWMLTDHLGSVRDVVSAGGNIVRQHINYDAFGNRVGEVHRSSTGALINSDSTAAVDALFGYAGREWDDSIDLQYNRARWYDPATGRFISQDPIGFEAGDANLYRYVGNGVMTNTDPSGLNPNRTGAKDRDEMLRIIKQQELWFLVVNRRLPTVRESVKMLRDNQYYLNVDYGSNHYYVFSRKDERWVDMRHASEACLWAVDGTPEIVNDIGGHLVEVGQYFRRSASRHGAEDIYSNRIGFQDMYEAIEKAKQEYGESITLYEVLTLLFEDLDMGNKTDAKFFSNLPASEEEWEKWRNTTTNWGLAPFLDEPLYYQMMVEREGAMVMPHMIDVHYGKCEPVKKSIFITDSIESPRRAGR
jgi:RHS repeat-associated protein